MYIVNKSTVAALAISVKNNYQTKAVFIFIMAPLAATAGAIPYTAAAAAAAAWLRPFVLPDEFFVISGGDWNPYLARFDVSCAMKVETSEGSHVCPSDFSMLRSLLLQCPDMFVLLPHDAG